DNKLREAINKAIQAHNFDCREEAQDEKMKYIELVDSTARIIIKEEVNSQLPQILPQAISDVATLVIEKNVTETIEVIVLTSTPRTQYSAAGQFGGVTLVHCITQKACGGTSHWGPKRQSFYRYASNLTSSKDVYSRRRIIAVTRLKIMKKYDYGHLEEIEVRRDDQQLYTFKEGDFKRLPLQDIEDMLLLLVQQKLTNLTIDERYGLNVALRMYTRRIVIQR
nr:hypothetical protein [Tanacetum cinerariifolium]